MGKRSKRKLDLLEEYIRALQAEFPEALVEPMRESGSETDFWVQVKIPEDKLEDVLNKTGELSYDWYMKYKVHILASASSTGP